MILRLHDYNYDYDGTNDAVRRKDVLLWGLVDVRIH